MDRPICGTQAEADVPELLEPPGQRGVVGNGEVHLKRALGNPHSSAAVLKIPLHLPFLTPPILLVHFPPAASGARRVLGMPIPSFRLVGLR